ncbi:MAG: energy-coupling factor ABC transporter permease [Isosphaeraceae bacterium]
MHIFNSVLDPKVVVATSAIGAAGLAYGLRQLQRDLGERTVVLLGTMSGFVFAAQMVNFPVVICSGHLLGGVLAATLLGPWGGAVVIATVLVVQCLLFGDGGLAALGANFLNMGLIGSALGYVLYATIRRAIGGPAGVVLGAMLAAWLSVLLAAVAFSAELAASGRWADFVQVLTWMTLVHAVIGVGEAIITGLVLRFILSTRPDLLYNPDPRPALNQEAGSATGVASPRPAWWRIGAAGLAVSLAVGVILAPFASEAPDGLEYVGERLNFLPADDQPMHPVLIPDYDARSIIGVGSLRVATAIAGAIGTLVVFGVGVLLGASVGRVPKRRGVDELTGEPVKSVAGGAPTHAS